VRLKILAALATISKQIVPALRGYVDTAARALIAGK
jgi:hypothetical protein